MNSDGNNRIYQKGIQMIDCIRVVKKLDIATTVVNILIVKLTQPFARIMNKKFKIN